MNWKKKLMLATGAFTSMPAAVIAHPDLTNGLRRRRTGTLRRRTSSVPFVVNPIEDQSVRVSVRVPKNRARRVPGQSIRRCSSYRADVSLIKIDGTFLKLEQFNLDAGKGATVEFDMSEMSEKTDGYQPISVTARVEVKPTDTEDCISTSPLSSFTLKSYTGGRDYLPSRDLDPVLLKIWHSGPIIIK